MRKKPDNPGKPAFFVIGLAVVALLVVLFAGAPPLQAEPYLAVREGLKCDFCHVNKTGGGKRTAAFAGTADHFLRSPASKTLVDPAGLLGGRVSLGANLRFSNRTLFRDEPDARGEVPNGRIFRSAEANDFAFNEGVAYLEADLIPEMLTFYVDESFTPGPAVSREVFGLLTGVLPWDIYLKAGRFFPPFGLRIQDDAAFTRSTTGFNFTNFSEGVELGLSTGPFFLAAAVANSGSPAGQDTRKQVSANGYYLKTLGGPVRSVLVGGSAAHNPTTERDAYGLHAGASFWELTILTEGNLIVVDTPDRGSIQGWAYYTEANWLATDRLNVKVAYDYFDPDDEESDDQRERISLGVESFFNKYLQGRLFYRISNDIPQNLSGNVNELVAEMHLFF
ncbi:MAG TPA: hypothetical protein VD811_07790 [Desulfuromonadales bacterium]|nr:hypothetical protein [Desulfuromonadales bacterium]